MAGKRGRLPSAWWSAGEGSARQERGRPTGRARLVEVAVAMGIVALLGAAALERLWHVQDRARGAALEGVRAGFHSAVQLVHLKWRSSGAAGPRALPLGDGRHVRVNTAGWPTIDPHHPGQDTADELRALLLEGSLTPGWSARERPRAGAGRGVYTLSGRGGGSFAYDARDGSVHRIEDFASELLVTQDPPGLGR